jgi:hypothetical protein
MRRVGRPGYKILYQAACPHAAGLVTLLITLSIRVIHGERLAGDNNKKAVPAGGTALKRIGAPRNAGSSSRYFFFFFAGFFGACASSRAAWAAANRAMGTRKGEQLT